MSQEEKQALRKAKKMAKMAKVQEKLAAKVQEEEAVEVVLQTPTKPIDEVHQDPVLTKEGVKEFNQ